MTVLLLPALQHGLNVIESAPLKGDVRNAKDTTFTVESWWQGRYQEQKTAYLNDNVGFRSDLVRANNQLNFALFRKLHAAGVILGKDGYLYESGYIYNWCGKDNMGAAAAKEKIEKLRYLQDTFRRAGKELLYVFTPSKARYYPEYFPDSMRCPATSEDNYHLLLAACKAAGIDYLDLNGWFQSMKLRRLPLFTASGIHWSYYGAALAADTIAQHIAGRLHLSISRLDKQKFMDSTTWGTEPAHEQEVDVQNGLNLIWKINPDEKFAHPLTSYISDSTTGWPGVVFISDSFYWIFINKSISDQYYRRWEFWNYNNEVWTSEHIPAVPMNGYDWPGAISNADAVVIMSTEPNLSSGGFGFIDAAYEKMHKDK